MEQGVLPSDGIRFCAAFGFIIGKLTSAVQQIALQGFPVVQGIIDRFFQLAAPPQEGSMFRSTPRTFPRQGTPFPGVFLSAVLAAALSALFV